MSIASQVMAYISTKLSTNVKDIGLDCNLWTEGYLDSTAILELVLWLEGTFKITIENEELTPENFATIRNIEDFVRRSTAGKAASSTEPARS
jgi:acyl carrier protein